jgi:phosphoribosylglycinamide formyltransferase 1
MTDIAVLISGHGSNLQAIIDAVESGQLPHTHIAAVVSDRADAFGLQRALMHGIPAMHFPYPPRSQGQQARENADYELAAMLEQYAVQWVVLAGWLRLLSNSFIQHFPSRVINLHPALPGQFPGLDAIARAFAAYKAGQIRETGVMVHVVPDEAVDAGPVIAIERVPIQADETLDTLTERIHKVEHRLLIQVLLTLCSDEAPGSTMSLNLQERKKQLHHGSDPYHE